MWRLSFLVLAACWSSAPPRAIEGPSTCEIHDVNVTTIHDAQLSVFDGPFARIASPFTRLDVVIDRSRGRAHLETEELVLEGELALDELPLRPRTHTMHEGWLAMGVAFAKDARGGQLRASVSLPEGLRPRAVVVELPCGALTFAEPPEAPDPVGSEYIVFAPGTRTPVLRSPGGPQVAIVSPPPAEPQGDPNLPSFEEDVSARVIARRAELLHVRIEGSNYVEGWVSTKNTREPGAMYGGLHGNMAGDQPPRLRCDRAVPIFVRSRGEVRRVGHYKPNATIRLETDAAAEHVAVDLGHAEVVPFVKRADVAACQ